MTLTTGPSLSLYNINNEFGRGYNLGTYHGIQWWKEDTSTGYFGYGALNITDFYGKRSSSPSVAGATNFYSPGSYTFYVPTYLTLFVQVAGAGGGGGGAWYGGDGTGYGRAGPGGGGGNSTFWDMVGWGGGGGQAANLYDGVLYAGDGYNGSATGGSYNATGGGSAGAPGASAVLDGSDYLQGGHGGSGGYCSKTFSPGALTVGMGIGVYVAPGGGAGNGGGGTYPGNSASGGYVCISWT